MSDDKLSAVDSDFVKGNVFSYAVVTMITETLTFFYHIEPPSRLVLAASVLINAACWFGGKLIMAWMKRQKLLNGESGFIA